ncbi:ATP-binding protein [Alteromonas oceanisediminis]|uniref:ATP-binding protein n=1 Tax=Alteromonas oceanisediminis TaxID=2836180 RepID=UPI001BDB6303|nr:ATP-binding protein [Alteromonas oceanisediminis]MBT0586074.1 HAMP domain-containing protein [Alteromonas oceanisediminis]
MTLSHLDPRNSFFGKIFLWFWFVALTSLGVGVFVARIAAPSADIQPITVAQNALLSQTAQRIERRSRSVNDVRQALRFISGRRGRLAFAIEVESQQFIFGFPPPLRPSRDVFLAQLTGQTASIITLGNSQFMGPALFSVAGTEYALFVGDTQAKAGSRLPLIVTVVLVALICSGLLCYFLARRFAAPVSAIQRATEALAQGQFETRITTLSHRTDELGRLSRETNKMAEQLQQLFAEHHRFLADVSHELRSPLTRLQLAIGIAEDTLQNGHAEQVGAVQQTLLPRIHKEAEAIEAMIAQLMYVSRQQVQMHAAQLKPLCVTTLLDECIDNAQFEAESLNKQIKRFYPADHQNLFVEANTELLCSAFDNVLRNAVHYARDTIQVRVEQATAPANGIRIVIEDNGQGVSAEALGQLFKPFYRTDSSRARDSGGVGLGLSIAQRAIHHHGGTIEAQHAQPCGLAIIIALPSSA